MANPRAAILDNIYFLDQAIDLLTEMPPKIFTHKNPPLYQSGVGPHLRHCMDHMELFLQGYADGKVDYDQRPRRDVQQQDPVAMRLWIGELSKKMNDLHPQDLSRALKVKMDCGSEMEDPWSGSTVLRELQFLLSHTVHHFALIAMILRDQGIEAPEGFGVAPSTLKHEAESSSCAP
ncbi:hypothetical protein P0Y35_13580 [Kiritimatiellaeota bacterium B1221]|nr:hypothetical protein [Kiritimatiellaeota bacterium B1221]